MTFLTSIAVFGASTLLLAGGAVAVEPTPTPTPGPQPGAVRVLSTQEVQDVLLEPTDFDGPFSVEDSADPAIAPTTCLERLDFLPTGAASGSRSLTDDLYTVVISGLSSHESVEEATAVMAAAKFVALGCPEIDVEGMKLAVKVSDGPEVGADDQFMITLEPGAEAAEMFKAELLYQRIANDVGYVGVLSADQPPPVDLAPVATRFHDKLSAASQGRPIPLTDLQAAHRLPLGGTYQGTRSTVSVSEPQAYTPTESALAEEGHHIMVTATVTNQGTDVMPTDMITSSATCDGVEAAPIDDHVGGLALAPPADINEGETVSWNLGYTVPKAGCELTVVMTYAMSDNIYFTGKA
jgi:hypothetical protein